jgi:hypothetical protein
MNRSTLFLILLLVVLGAIVLFLLPSDKERETSYSPANVQFAVDSASVIKIDIYRQGKSVTFENIGGKWTIIQPIRYAADRSGIEQLLSGLAKFKIGSLISSNPEKQNLFQVDSTGTRLTITDRSSKTSTIILGKMGPSFSEIYFRLPDSKEVYLGEGIESWSLTKEVREWRDKTIFAARTEGIKELTFDVGPAQYSFRRDSSGWKSQDRAVDAVSLNGALSTLANLKADDFVDSVVIFQHRPVSIQIKGTESATLSLIPAVPDSSKYYVQVLNSKSLFIVAKWTAQQLMKPVESQIASLRHPIPSPVKKEAPKIVATPPPVKPAKVTPPVTKQTAVNPPPAKRPTPSAGKSISKPAESVPAPVITKTEKKESPPAKNITTPAENTHAPATKAAPVTPATHAGGPLAKQSSSSATADDEGDLTVYTVGKSETMTSVAKKFNVSVEQILKWNLLKSISVKPGQELYIYQRKK